MSRIIKWLIGLMKILDVMGRKILRFFMRKKQKMKSNLDQRQQKNMEIDQSPFCPFFQFCWVGRTKSCLSVEQGWKECPEVAAHGVMWRRLLLFQKLE